VPVAEWILAAAPRPTVVITADNGSSDQESIALLAKAGIEVIVTDRRLIPDSGPPEGALACINPQRTCGCGNKSIAGGMVAWLLVAMTRREPVDCVYLQADTRLGLAEMLDDVACATSASSR